jgi:hypothetical protein
MYRIGIITNSNTLFSNGLSQNAYFLYEVFRLAGHRCSMLCYDASYKMLDGLSVPVKTISTSNFNSSSYDILITVAIGINKEMYDKCKASNTRVIGFVCGNIFANNLLDFYSDDPDAGGRIIKRTQPIDILWIIGSFNYMSKYLELMRGAPSMAVPHLWSPKVLEDHATTKFKFSLDNLRFNPVHHTNGKLNILILEPNSSFTKNALLPLVACEELFIKHPDLIDTIYVFNYPDKSTGSLAVLDNLSVKSKVRIFKGLHMADILNHFNQQSSMPVVFCHQIMHQWNYLYYEMMYYGIPFVHNSDMMKGYGYHYNGCDIDAAVYNLVQVQKHHNKLYELQKKKNAAYLKTLDCYDPDTIQTWNTLLNTTMGKL